MNINKSFKTTTTSNSRSKIRGKNKAETRLTSVGQLSKVACFSWLAAKGPRALCLHSWAPGL